ncbi:porin family protein [Thalassotalea maritima]|uniref:porin family protein n=1 Tax=Thalassotalea maritima TaxID=3242416 RepID=UPI003527BC70
MKTVKNLSVALTIAASLTSYNVFSHEFLGIGEGGYVGIAVGESDLDMDWFDHPTGWEIYGGWELSDYFGLEVSYIDFGKFENPYATDTNGLIQSIDVEAYTLGLIGKIPITETIDIFAKIGYSHWDADVSLVGYSDNSWDTFWGVGANYKVSEHFAVGVRYSEYKLDAVGPAVWEDDVSLVSLNLEYHF